ncbi:alpha/beta fold hydrolase [Nitriliruptor alkaliphilus]|uniref:alpha/beta fold hydrolase n=1 Tax=Nitriliruptor alkaliphilus TaxID=427918 RepID=UPI000697ACF3|nr:alpha/beta hydrolase [Nitriliruptor alkaliphilus]
MAIRQHELRDLVLEAHDLGTGEPVVFIQTALIADELLPLAKELPLADGFRRIVYHRRGYAGSSPVAGPGSIARDAADCEALLTALRIERAHVVGLSYSGAVALQLAADAPDRVHSLVLIEPPPVHIPSAGEFRQANEELLTTRRSRGATAALDELLGAVIGPDWRQEIEHDVPGASEQMQRDLLTFFDTDLPGLLTWQFDHRDAQRITCPVLHVGGSDTHRWFLEVRDLIHDWFPHAEDAQIEGARHSLAATHTRRVAETIAEFLHRVSREAPSP